MRRPLAALVLLAVGLLAAPVASASSYADVIDITFPTVQGVTFGDDYHDGRSGGRVHKATDLLGEKLMELYATVGGTITALPETQPGHGWTLTLSGDDGRQYSYLHINNDTPGTDDGRGGTEWAYAPGLVEGSRVERGQWIAYMGDSGNAEGTSPHLHFEIVDPAVSDPYGTNRVNPYPSLVAAVERGDYAAAGGGVVSSLEDAPGVERIAGPDRIATAVAISERTFSRADAVVLAAGYTFADAVVAGPLADALGSPLLTTGAEGLDDRVATELRRLRTHEVILVGGPAALGEPVVDALGDLGIETERLAGDDATGTAAVVAERVWRLRGTGAGERAALVALGSHPEPVRAWPDALTAGWAAAVLDVPVLLVTPDEATGETLASADGADLVLVGGEFAITPEVEGQLAEVAGDVDRWAGQDRFGTALAVLEAVVDDAEAAQVQTIWAATGYGYADALTAAPAIAAEGAAFVLIDGSGQGADRRLDSWLAQHATANEQLVVLGGEDVVGAGGVAALQRRLVDPVLDEDDDDD